MTTSEAIYLLGGAALLALLVALLTAVRRSRESVVKGPTGSVEDMLARVGADIRISRTRVPATPLVATLMAMATDQLGNRARKVHEILLNAEPTQSGLMAAVDTIPQLSLLFIDQDRLTELARQMKAKILEASDG